MARLRKLASKPIGVNVTTLPVAEHFRFSQQHAPAGLPGGAGCGLQRPDGIFGLDGAGAAHYCNGVTTA